MDTQTLLYLIPAAGVIGLVYAALTAGWIGKQDPGDRRMQTIAEQIFKGAMAFIGAEYRVLAIFIGRFFGPLRASVQLVAGIFRMPYWQFQFANFTSAFVWAAALLTTGDVIAKFFRWLW